MATGHQKKLNLQIRIFFMTKRFLIFLSFLFVSLFSFGQKELSSQAEVSLLTCDKGYELYSAYGHSAIRIKDPANDLDIVFNYGTFDYHTDYFLLKFIRGTLDYSLSIEPFDMFINTYHRENRSVQEQVFDLTLAEKQAIFNRLIVNYETEERNYRYDFFYDNCSSRIHEIIKEVLGEELSFGNDLQEKSPETFRDLIDPALKFSPWADFGVLLIMGYPTDNVATNYQKMFLPIHMKERFASATYKNRSFVKSEKYLFVSNPLIIENPFYLKPIFVFSILFILIALVSFKNYKNNKHYYWIDCILFFITGLVGIFFLFMWFGTRHSPTFQNMNMFWAMPLNILALFFLKSKKIKPYLAFMAVLNVLGYFILPEVFHIAIIPISLMMAVRYWKLYKQF